MGLGEYLLQARAHFTFLGLFRQRSWGGSSGGLWLHKLSEAWSLLVSFLNLVFHSFLLDIDICLVYN